MMSAVELDPLFVKALKLLQSKAKDSSAQLKAMLDDAIAQRKGLKVPSQSGDHTEKGYASKGKNDDEAKRKDGEKRPLDKSMKDPFEPDIKRSKLDASRPKDKESKDKEKDREKSKKEKERKERDEAQRQKDKAEKEKKEKEAMLKQEAEVISDDEELTQQMDAGDFARDLGIACVVCRQFDVSSGNQLVECQECHSLYHQECHKPPVTGQDVRDPRFVWYCSRCTKSFKKMMAQKPITKSSKPSPTLPSSAKEPISSSIAKVSKPESDPASQAFRKIDPKAIVTPKDPGSLPTSSNAMVGLAGLAANLTKPRGDSRNPVSSKKSSDSKTDSSKSQSKSESKSLASTGGAKQDSSAKQSSSSSSSSVKVDGRSKAEAVKSSGKEEQREGKKSDSKSKTDEKKSSDSSSRKEDKEKEKKEREKQTESHGKSSKEDKKSESAKSSPSNSRSSSNSPPSTPSSSTAATESVPTKSSSSSSSNKQAVANLSMVTANKRIQMMKKKAQAQTKPLEKKVLPK